MMLRFKRTVSGSILVFPRLVFQKIFACIESVLNGSLCIFISPVERTPPNLAGLIFWQELVLHSMEQNIRAKGRLFRGRNKNTDG